MSFAPALAQVDNSHTQREILRRVSFVFHSENFKVKKSPLTQDAQVDR